MQRFDEQTRCARRAFHATDLITPPLAAFALRQWAPTRDTLLGTIPAPRNLISVAFGGPDKKTLYGVAIRDVPVMSIQVIA